MQTQERVEMKMPSDMMYVGPIRAFIVRLAQRLGFSPLRIEDIELATDEVCNNAVEHGSKHEGAFINVVLTFDPAQFEILVRDTGPAKDKHWLYSERLEEVRRSMSPESERGHGIYLMETLADRVGFRSNELGGTDVSMVFCLDESPETRPPLSSTVHV